MIIFSDKKTGKILMRVDGFGHDRQCLNMSVEPVKDQIIEKKIIKPESQSAKLALEIEDPKINTKNSDYEIIKNNLLKK